MQFVNQYRYRRFGRSTALAFCVLFASLVMADDGGEEPPEIPRKEFAANRACRVVRVVECDTVIVMLDGKQTRVGLIGVSPPNEPAARDAARDFTSNLLTRESVFLDTEPAWPDKDPSGRMWAYVYRAPDGLLVNVELVRRGYARIAISQPYQLDDAMRFYQQRARIAHKGIWAEPPPVEKAEPSKADAAAPQAANPARSPTTQPAKTPLSHETDSRPTAGAKEPSKSTADPATVMVWITKTGKKYHREGCEHLKKSATQVTLADAKAKGLEPCQTCEPPQ